MTSSEIVRSFSRTQKVALKALPTMEAFTDEVLGTELAAPPAPADFPAIPKPLTITEAVKKSMKAIPAVFGRVQPTSRRKLDDGELLVIGAEYLHLVEILKPFAKRAEDIKEMIRVHQEMVAEEEGRAFPKDVVRGGKIVAKATPRDAKGHYILATSGNPETTPIPDTTFEFSNQYTSGKLVTDLENLTREYEAGNLPEAVYKAISSTKRVIDAEKLRSYVLRTGDASILKRISSRGRASSAMNLRGLKKPSTS